MPDTQIKNEVAIAMEDAGCLYEHPGYWQKTVGKTTMGITGIHDEDTPSTLDAPGVFYTETEGTYVYTPCNTTREAVAMIKKWKSKRG